MPPRAPCASTSSHHPRRETHAPQKTREQIDARWTGARWHPWGRRVPKTTPGPPPTIYRSRNGCLGPRGVATENDEVVYVGARHRRANAEEGEGLLLGRHGRENVGSHSAAQRAREARARETAAHAPHDGMARAANSEVNLGATTGGAPQLWPSRRSCRPRASRRCNV